MSKKIAYFIDYGEDNVIPLGANPNLLDKYEELSVEVGRGILGRYDTRLEMMDDVAEFASFARHGAYDYEELSNKEMQEKIDEVIKELAEQAQEPTRKLNALVNDLRQAMSGLSETEQKDIIRRLEGEPK